MQNYLVVIFDEEGVSSIKIRNQQSKHPLFKIPEEYYMNISITMCTTMRNS